MTHDSPLTRREAMRRMAALAAVPALSAAGNSKLWPSEPPAGCPFPASGIAKGLAFTGRHTRYTQGDTWYPSWASDGNLYSPWTDGKVNGLSSNSNGVEKPLEATTGHATILGDSPLHLDVVNVGLFNGDPRPYGGRYPCGSLVHNGVWYYGTYCLLETKGKGLNWDVMGPFVGFRHSRNFGKTWIDTPHTPAAPLFGEPVRPGGNVRIGSPHFVDFGRNMEHSPDGKAYLVAHGADPSDPMPRDANVSWITGDEVYLLRVQPGVQSMNDPRAYEFFAGNDPAGKPRWTSDLAAIRPLISWNNHAGCVTMTYNPGLKRYLMCVTDGGNTISRFSTYILESERVTGPWRLLCYLRNFGEQAYFVNIPSKFIGTDGRVFWLMYAANFTNGYLKTNYAENPPGSGYGMCVQEVELPN